MVTENNIRALGVLTNAQQVETAIQELQAADLPMEQVSVIAKNVEQGEHLQHVAGDRISTSIGNQDVNTTGVVGNTLSAATWGSVLVGLSSLALPGLGVVLAAGSVGVALVSSLAGVAVSAASQENLVKAITELGIPEAEARVYGDRLQQSDYLLIIDGTAAEIHRAETILHPQGIQNWGVYHFVKSADF